MLEHLAGASTAAARLMALLLVTGLSACGADQTPPPDAGALLGAPLRAEPRKDVAAGGRRVAEPESAEAGPAPAPSARPKRAATRASSPRTEELRKAVGAVLDEYHQAFEARELARLERVWRMTAIERALIEGTWANCSDVSLSIEPRAVRVDDEQASVDFEQRLELGCSERKAVRESHLLASLVRRPTGGWLIVNIAERPGGDRGVAARPGAVVGAPVPESASAVGERLADRAAREASALLALKQYASALEHCDLTELARVWIMNPLERQILEGVCYQYEQLAVSISGQAVAVDGDRARIHFTQDISYLGTAGSRQTRSDLTALMVRRPGGDWAIWKIRESSAR